MADVDTFDILRVGASWMVDSAFEIANVFHLRVNAGGGLTFSQAAADIAEYMDALYTYIRTYMVNNMSTNTLTLHNVTQDTVYGAFAWNPPRTGVSTGDMLPFGVCLHTWARTYKPRVQIRKYFGLFAEDQITDGQWSATVRGAAGNAMAYHIALQTMTNGLQLLGIAYNRTLGTYALGVSATTAEEPAYQRRRRRGRGS